MALTTLVTAVTFSVLIDRSVYAVTLPLHTTKWSGFKPAVELDGEFGNEGGSPLDLGGVFASVSVGSQEFHVHIDTGSSMLIIPAPRSQCPTCPPTQRASYSPSGSSATVPCHSSQCNFMMEQEDTGHVAAICLIQQADGFAICPHRDDPSWEPGKGTCKTEGVSINRGEPLVACEDHLDPPCEDVVNVYGYPCSQDMSTFGLVADTLHPDNLLSDYCPETCNTCQGGSGSERFCADNNGWTDANGRRCNYYAQRPDECFSTHAHVACPVSCNSCGDCCTSDDACYFYSAYADGSAVTGAKYVDTVSLGGLSASAVVGVYTWVHDEFEISPDVDGILGLSFATGDRGLCNPACAETVWDSLQAAFPPGLSDVFALCLSGMHAASPHRGISSWDIGEYDRNKYSGAMHWFTVPRFLHDAQGELDPQTGQHSRPNSYYVFEGGVQALQLGTYSALVSSGSFCSDGVCDSSATREYTDSYLTLVDSGVSQLMFPPALYNAYANYFLANHIGPDGNPTFTRTTANGGDEPIPVSDLFQQGTDQNTCAGPVAESYDPDSEFERIRLSFRDQQGQLRDYVLEPHHYLVKRREVEGLQTLTHGWWLCNGIGLTPSTHLSVENPIVLGTVFMSNHYTVFDRHNDRVGFAQIQDCTEGLQLVNHPCSVVLPENAQWNDCTPTLSDGSACEFTCIDGYAIDGQTGEIICQAGSLNQLVQCVEMESPCSLDPCQHDSYCIWLQPHNTNEYVCCDDPDDNPYAMHNGIDECQCPPGYESPESQCATLVDNCASVPCENDGQCDNRINSYLCTCADGYMGDNCQVDIDECAQNDPCGVSQSQGHRSEACVQVDRSATAPSGFICQCSPGWSGSLCTIENACESGSHDCGSNSYCEYDGQSILSYACPCVAGYQRETGSDECTMIDLCENTPCENGGVCTSSLGAYDCTCVDGFAGNQCEREVDGCEINHQPCGVFGECQSNWGQPNGYVCNCHDSYSGTNCENPPEDPCSLRTNPCQNGAECESQAGSSYTCVCQPNWSGDNCAEFADPCQNAPCGIHGRCETTTSGPEGFTCQCSDGFTGDRCNVLPVEENDVCTSAPCQNGGYCERAQGSYDCTCQDGFEGGNCESDVDECACTDRSDDLRAISRFTASLDCEIAVRMDCSLSLAAFEDPQGRTLAQLCPVSCDACEPMCGEHGLCHDGINQRSCRCIDGWTKSPECSGEDCPCTEPPATTPGTPSPDGCSEPCRASSQCKIAGVCLAGECTAETDVPDYTPCDDERAGTGRDQCIGGVCSGQSAPNRPPPSPTDMTRPTPSPTDTIRPTPPTPPGTHTAPATSADTPSTADVLESLRLQATLDVDMDQLSDDFSTTFGRAAAVALQISEDRVTVLRIEAGSVIVEFSIDISESEIAELRRSSGSDSVQAAILAIGEIGGYTLVSVELVVQQSGADTLENPCATGDWQSCTVAGQPIVVMIAAGLGACVVLSIIVRKVCCKKRAKVGATSDYA